MLVTNASSSPNDFSPGARLVVEDTVALASREHATLLLFVCESEAPAVRTIEPGQSLVVEQGTKNFRSELEAPAPGEPHVSLYDPETGQNLARTPRPAP